MTKFIGRLLVTLVVSRKPDLHYIHGGQVISDFAHVHVCDTFVLCNVYYTVIGPQPINIDNLLVVFSRVLITIKVT